MKKLDRKSVWYFFTPYLLIVLGIVVLIILVFLSDGEYEFERLVIFFLDKWFWFAVPIIVSYIWAELFYDSYKYELTENSFKKELGVIWKKYVTIPYDKIQNIDIIVVY